MGEARTYLVTGGLGFLGAPLVKALLESGHAVRVFDNGSRGSAARLGRALEDVELIQGDIRDAEAVARALQGADGVCHFASVNGTQFFYEKPVEVLEVGVKGMLNVLDGCRRAGVGELILASSSEVYQTPPTVPTDETAPLSIPDPFNPRYSYGGSKIISELMAIHYGRASFERVLIVRPHNVFGPDMGWEHVIPQFVTRLMQLKGSRGGSEMPFPIQGTGEQSRSFIYLDDFIAGLMLVITRGEHLNLYHLGTREERTIRDVAHQVAACLGMRIRIEPGPDAAGSAPRRCPEIGKLERLGFRPRWTFQEALATTVRWYAARLESSGAPAVAGGAGHD